MKGNEPVRGDRVRLTPQAATTFNNSPKVKVDWATRRGILIKINSKGAATVLWEGRNSYDYWPVKGLEKAEK